MMLHEFTDKAQTFNPEVGIAHLSQCPLSLNSMTIDAVTSLYATPSSMFAT